MAIGDKVEKTRSIDDVAPAVTKPTENATTTQMREMVRAFSEEMIPSIVAAVRGSNQPAQSNGRVITANDMPKCGECKQVLGDGINRGCGGKHESIVVFPTKYPDYGSSWDGVYINGIRYYSDNAGQKVIVPAAAAGSILNAVQMWEQNEFETRQGRKGHGGGQSGRTSADAPVSAWR
jgi:hypothetical protein